jgi:signal transduction histidine kinase
MEDPIRILVVDDDRLIRGFFKEIFPEKEVALATAGSGDEALAAIASTPFHLVVTDLKMPGVDGLRLLREIQKTSPETVVVVMTGRGSIKDAVDLMREGAYDIITKPFRLDEMRLVIEKALKHQRICRHNEELKEKLATSEKLAVIGRLAAGVAHELNNPLDGVLRFVNLSLERVAEDDPVHEYLLESRTGLVRMADIVKSLLRFSRNIVIENEPKDLEQLLREALNQIRHANAGNSIQVRCIMEQEHLRAPAGVFQVFTNLIKNAFDAMVDRDQGLLEITATRDNGCTILRFKDNGCGIAPSEQKKIFEPFYTTKEVGKGTGLGLSICARIMEKFHGTLTLESEPGSGSVFTVRFPTPA